MLLRRMPAVLLPLCCYSSYAAEEPIELSPIIVTATRTARTADETLASVTVITREEIERRQATSVQEVLRGVPGLGIANSGGLGKATSVFLRGTNSDHVLVLIDGMRVGSATLGTTQFQLIPIDQIERIEIVRGPRASLYGSEAIGGVIQIFTRKGGGALRPQFSAGGGSHATYQLAGGISGGGDHGWFNLGASRLDTRGFNACSSTPAQPGGCFTFEPDDDGYTNNAGSARLGYRFENGLETPACSTPRETLEFDGSSVNEEDFVQQAVSGQIRFSPTASWDVTILGGRSLDESENFKAGVPEKSIFDTERQSALFQNDFRLAPGHPLTVGFDYYDDLIESTEDFAETSRDNKAGFGQYQGAFDDLDWVLGVRRDDNERFGGEWTGNVGLGYTFGPPLRLTFGWGAQVQGPVLQPVVLPRLRRAQPRSGALRERRAGRERDDRPYCLVAQWLLHRHRRSHRLPPRPDVEVRDPRRQRRRSQDLWAGGCRVDADFRLGHRRQPESHRPREPRRGPEQGQCSAAPGRADVPLRSRSGLVRALPGGAYDLRRGTALQRSREHEAARGLCLVDLRAGVELYKGLFLKGKVGNLLDKEYETADFFNQDDTNLFITLRYQPDAL